MKNSIKIKRIIFIVLVIASLVSIGRLGIDINKIKKGKIKEQKKYEAIVSIDETEKIMSFKFIPVEDDY